MEPIQIDGSYLEGGGQIIRTALALSTLTGRHFIATKIRQGRPNPGLKHQHLYCIKALEKLSGAKSRGAALGSTSLKFEPGPIKGQTISIDIGTAGSISLLLQSVLIPSLFADTKVRLKISGGTDTKWAMPYNYFEEVFLPHLKKYAQIQVQLIRRGYYPKGGGSVEIKIKPEYDRTSFSTITDFVDFLRKEDKKITLLNQGELLQIKGISHASHFLEKAEVAERQSRNAKVILGEKEVPIQIRSEYSETYCPGSGIVLWAKFSNPHGEIDEKDPIILGADSLGERGKPAEKVGGQAAESLIKEIDSKTPVDFHLADNLIPFLALFGGQIKTSQITQHTRTNIYTVEQFLGKCFEIDEEENIVKTSF